MFVLPVDESNQQDRSMSWPRRERTFILQEEGLRRLSCQCPLGWRLHRFFSKANGPQVARKHTRAAAGA